MAIRKSFDESRLAELRRMSSEQVLLRLSIQVRSNLTFVPRKS
jgi:hypothetical protein